MHQEHNIPWHILASNFSYVHECRKFTPPRSGLIPRNRPTQSAELNHFTRKLISTIHTFALTERQKYPPAHELVQEARNMDNELLFSDELRARYPSYLNEENQKLSFWIQSATSHYGVVDGQERPRYDTEHSPLADVVKILIHENQMPALLKLANHPHIPLLRLNHLQTFYHSLGFDQIAEAALLPYLFWNFADAAGYVTSGEYESMVTTKEVVREATEMLGWLGYKAEKIPHWMFYYCMMDEEKFKVNLEERDDLERRAILGLKLGGPGSSGVERLEEYLKHLFALLYRYEVVVRECGGDPEWQNKVVSYPFCRIFGVRSVSEQGEDGRWYYRF